MRKNYLVAAFETTLSQKFPSQAETLKAAFEARLNQLRSENAGASPELQRHLEGQILPGIAVYETLLTVLSKDEALSTVHGYVEQRAWRLKKAFLKLMRLPGLYRKVPGDLLHPNAEAVRRNGGLCRAGNSNRRRRMAHRHDEMSLS